MIRSFCIAVVLLVAADVHLSSANTLLVTGDLSARVRVKRQFSFAIEKEKDHFAFRLALPPTSDSKSSSQKISSLSVEASPKPASAVDETDRYGNRFRTITWKRLKNEALVTLSFDATLVSSLHPLISNAQFPLTSVPAKERLYLQSSEQVQSDSSAIKSKARGLTAGAHSEYDAVTAIMRYAANQITYSYNPKQYDALYSLKTGDGNCQNYAHLALALLRASGIPGRVVGGYTLKEKWKVPAGPGKTIIYGGEQGGHAWLEIWFPDLGWLPYDPQESQQFISTRHLKETHGLQVKDITSNWRSTLPVPSMTEQTSAEYVSDLADLTYRGEASEPRRYVVSNLVKHNESASSIDEPIVKSQPIKPPPKLEKPKQKVKPPVKPVTSKNPPSSSDVVFGNTQFPDVVALYNTIGDTGSPSYSRETAEYVTSSDIYAQAFTLDHDMITKSVGLAMKKFGGSGSVYIDVVADEDGKPGLEGVRSLPIDLDKIRKMPGYTWVDFQLAASDARFKPGKYWIVLRHSGDAVMNWFYTPGKRYGGADDTRSTAKGWEWEDLLTYEFVFRVKGAIESI